MNGGRGAMAAITVEGLSKYYRRSTAGHKLRTLKSALVERSLIAGLRPEQSIHAIEDVSFTVARGEALGVIGSNGSGKSTLLKLVAGILRPSSGTITVDGRVAALIELGAGFHPEISGRENIYINGAVLGLSKKQIDHRYDDIVEFSGLEDFIEEPVKHYSSGMYIRLGFAVAIHTDPDVLLVDEVLAVGDEAFTHRCMRRIEEYLARERTLLLVSHSLAQIEEICDRCLWVEKGKLRLEGHPRRVLDAYRQDVAEAESKRHRESKEQREKQHEVAASVSAIDTAVDELADADPEHPAEPAEEPEVMRWGSGEATIERVVLRAAGEERYHFESGESVTFEIDVRCQRDFDDFVFGIALSTPRGVECWGTNTDLAGFVPKRMASGTVRVKLECPQLRLGPGEYLLDLAVHAREGTPYDYRRQLLSFSVTAREKGIGLYFPEHQWSFSPGIEWHERAGDVDDGLE